MPAAEHCEAFGAEYDNGMGASLMRVMEECMGEAPMPQGFPLSETCGDDARRPASRKRPTGVVRRLGPGVFGCPRSGGIPAEP